MPVNRIGKRLTLLIALGLMLLVAVGCSDSAEVETDDRAIFGGTQTIRSDETVAGDVALFGGILNIEEGAVIDGDVSVFGGDLKLDGTLNGDLALFGGNVETGLTAEFNGSVSSMGGNISADRLPGEDSDRLGDLGEFLELEEIDPIEEPEPIEPVEPIQPVIPIERSFLSGILSVVGNIFGKLMTGIAWGVVGFIATMFVPQHVRRVADTAQRAPVASTLIGFLAIVAAIPIAIIATITIIGIPITLFLGLATAIGTVLGWIAIGYLLGDRLLRGANVRSPRTPAATAIGAAVLGLAWGLVTEIPVLDFLANLLWIWGLGAVLLTRGGTQPYPRAIAGTGTTPPLYETPVGSPFSEARPTGASSAASGNLFADLAADLGMDEDDLLDDDLTPPRR